MRPNGHLKTINSQFYKTYDHRTGSDKGIGEFTCINRQGKRMADYVICSKVLFGSMKQFDIELPTVYHISWVLQISNTIS